MNQVLNEDQFAAFIGIDWADVKHDVCLQALESNAFEFSTLEHTPEAIAAWTSHSPAGSHYPKAHNSCMPSPAMAGRKWCSPVPGVMVL